MNSQHSPKNSVSFYAVLTAPVLSFFLGAGLIYYLDIPWQLVSSDGDVLRDVALGIGCGALTFALLLGVIRLKVARSLREVAQKLLPIFRQFSAGQKLILSAAAGIGEEVLFRGFLQIYLYDFIGVGPAILITSVIFGLLHFGSVSYFLLATLMGIALGTAYHFSGSLLLIMVWHTIYDVLAFWVVTRYPDLMRL